jgi:hypothetical protein
MWTLEHHLPVGPAPPPVAGVEVLAQDAKSREAMKIAVSKILVKEFLDLILHSFCIISINWGRNDNRP